MVDVEARAVEHGRTTLQVEGFVPPGETGPAELFSRARGYEVASREGFKELLLADFVERRPGLVAEVGGAADDYTMVTFDTVCPDEHLASFGRLLGMLIAEIPLGDLDLEDSEWTPERLRAAEQRCVSIGRHVLTALAIAPDGSVAGSSDVRINAADSSHGQIGITLVDPAHRGHRLGLALKIATARPRAGGLPRLRERRHLQRRGQRAHERRQRGARLWQHRDPARAPEEALTQSLRSRT